MSNAVLHIFGLLLGAMCDVYYRECAIQHNLFRVIDTSAIICNCDKGIDTNFYIWNIQTLIATYGIIPVSIIVQIQNPYTEDCINVEITITNNRVDSLISVCVMYVWILYLMNMCNRPYLIYVNTVLTLLIGY